MSETEKALPPELMKETEDHTPPPEDPSQVLSPKRRSALVAYLAVMFSVAFLFVAVTLAMEAKRLKISNDSNIQANASLYNSINALQDENRKLQNEVNTQKAEKEALYIQMENSALEASNAYQAIEESIASLKTEKTRLLVNNQNLESQVELLTKRVEDAVAVSELLQKAIALNEDGDLSSLSEVLSQIEPFKDLLSKTEKDIYDSLVVD